MLVLVAPRSARGLGLEQLQQIADQERVLVEAGERRRLQQALLSADPGLYVHAEDESHGSELHARGRSGLTIRLGPVWHEVELPDWHEGTAGTWLSDRFVALLRVFPRVSGGYVLDAEEGTVLDPTQQAGLVERYRYRVQPGPHAPILPILDMAPPDDAAFARLAEQVLRRRGASAADRAWFFTTAAYACLDRDWPDTPAEVRYIPSIRLVQVVRFSEDGADAEPMPGRLQPGVADDPPQLPEDLTGRDKDDEAIAYLASLLSWA